MKIEWRSRSTQHRQKDDQQQQSMKDKQVAPMEMTSPQNLASSAVADASSAASAAAGLPGNSGAKGRYVGSRPIKLRKSTWKNRSIEQVRKKDKEKQALLSLFNQS